MPGSGTWWQSTLAQGVPCITRLDNDTCRVEFFWRDPAGDASHSATRRVWVCITGITDHHAHSGPQSMRRVGDSAYWHWATTLNSHWRGSYCFIPSEREDDFPPAAFEPEPDRQALREGWRKLFPRAIADPLNPDSWRGGRGHPTSALQLPDAPIQPGWDRPDTPFHPPQHIEWHSTRLGNCRRVWLFATGDDAPAQRPLAILLDGQFWAESMPVWPALQQQTNSGALPQAVYLLIDNIDLAHRSTELPCNPEFWLAVQEELLPLVRQHQAWSPAPQTTVVAGQSFGGLSALYAALFWPQVFGCALSQSGSFWWPHRQRNGEPGWLVAQLSAGRVSAAGLAIYLEAGLREPLILQAHQRLVPLLQPTGRAVIYHQVDGGHDALCWRGGLMNGLMALWSVHQQGL
ncbi:enterochelin esterase [Shimwellia pseudoproteus]|nr:enterochelin esterase [Shimwellia pseudoproteus]